MENPEFWIQFGVAGVFILYLMKKETLWEAEKKEFAAKYEGLLREAILRAATIDSKLAEISDAIQGCRKVTT